MQLQVKTPTGLKGFRLQAHAGDRVDSLLVSAARQARLPRSAVKLSRAGELLDPQRMVGSYCMDEADVLTLHVKLGHQAESQRRSAVTHSIGNEGLGFFVNILTSEGRQLYRSKVYADEMAAGLIRETMVKARPPTGPMRDHLELSFRVSKCCTSDSLSTKHLSNPCHTRGADQSVRFPAAAPVPAARALLVTADLELSFRVSFLAKSSQRVCATLGHRSTA